jgi:DNA-binding CsgD family transcriptional regulator
MARMQVVRQVCVSGEQRAILGALADGARADEIAALTNKARSTVEAHIRTLFLKFNARSRSHLVALAFRSGVLSLETNT